MAKTQKMGDTLAILGAAVGATFASSANAALISTTPDGFTSIDFVVGVDSSYSFDMDGDGNNDFSITSGSFGGPGPSIFLSPLQANTGSQSIFDLLTGSTNSDTLSLSQVKAQETVYIVRPDGASALESGRLVYSALGVPVTSTVGETAATGTFGYLAGVYSASVPFNGEMTSARYSLVDYGIDPTRDVALEGAVPEPETWALLIAGFGGIGMAMRRDRKRKGTPRPVC